MGKAGGEVLWIGISSHKRRMWLFPHPLLSLDVTKTVKWTGVHLRAPCCPGVHSTNESGWTFCICPNVHCKLSDRSLCMSYCFALTGKMLLDYCFASQQLSCWTSSTQSSLTPHLTQACLPNPVTHLPRNRMALTPTLHMSSLGHSYLLWIPDLGGQARSWWWVMLSQSCSFSMLTLNLQQEENSYLLSLYSKDKKSREVFIIYLYLLIIFRYTFSKSLWSRARRKIFVFCLYLYLLLPTSGNHQSFLFKSSSSFTLSRIPRALWA